MTGTQHVDPTASIVRGWLTARSVARGLPAPVDDSGGWRVETGAADELRRYVFAEPSVGLRKVGESVRQPKVLLKLFGSEHAMRRVLPPDWQVRSEGYFMTLSKDMGEPLPLPSGFKTTVVARGDVIEARVRTRDGVTVASGFAAETHDSFVYDRIYTAESYRRQGLARAVVKALGAARRSPAARQVLVATEDGRGLYLNMGWEVLSPWTTACIQKP